MQTQATRMRLGLVGLNQVPLDWYGNFERIRNALAQAREQGIQLLCYPELAVTGYGCEDRFLHPDTCSRALAMLQDFAAEVGDEVLLIGLPLRFEGRIYNAIAVLNQGRIRAFCPKSHLASEGIHYEPRWFKAWPLGKQAQLQLGEHLVPVGSLTFAAAGFVFATEICEDAWVDQASRPCALVRDAHYIFNASASHFSLGKADIRERLVRSSSDHFGVGYAYANLVGCESGRAIYDGELLFAEAGQIVQRSDRFYFQDVRVLAHDTAYDARDHEVDVPLQVAPVRDGEVVRQLERTYAEREVEFARAASLALFDYMRKSRSRGFTLSLSGGVDSATVAVLVWVMVNRLVHETSVAERRQKLGYFAGLDLACEDVGVWMTHMLTTVYQATRNSGPVTRNAAQSLAQAIGARYLEFDIDGIVESYKGVVSQALGRDLTWEQDDIALQNIQARVRSPGIWMLANISGSLLLSTSNRSEVAVGYATMDGDTSGGLSPIAGVEKTFLRRWLVAMERGDVPGIPALPALRLVNQQAPTAELRPPDAVQEDEKDLMPYEVLDALEAELIAKRGTPLQAFEQLCRDFADVYQPAQLKAWTHKFCRMFTIVQWKRERYAPAFHLDDRNLDPKTWARFPILASPFEAERDALDRATPEL